MTLKFCRSHLLTADEVRASASSTISPGRSCTGRAPAACSRRRLSSSLARAFLSLGSGPASSPSSLTGAGAPPLGAVQRGRLGLRVGLALLGLVAVDPQGLGDARGGPALFGLLVGLALFGLGLLLRVG